MKDKLKKDIKKVINYLWYDERHHYEEEVLDFIDHVDFETGSKPTKGAVEKHMKSHIFVVLKRLKEAIK